MLLGQYFRRRQHRALSAGIDCLQHSQQGHHGLTRADFTCQQAVHRAGLRHVVRNIGRDRDLTVGKRKRQSSA